MEIENPLLLAVPLHVDRMARKRTDRKCSIVGTFSGRSFRRDVEDVGSYIFADVSALGRPPDQAGDLVPDRIVPAQEIGEAFQFQGLILPPLTMFPVGCSPSRLLEPLWRPARSHMACQRMAGSPSSSHSRVLSVCGLDATAIINSQ